MLRTLSCGMQHSYQNCGGQRFASSAASLRRIVVDISSQGATGLPAEYLKAFQAAQSHVDKNQFIRAAMAFSKAQKELECHLQKQNAPLYKKEIEFLRNECNRSAEKAGDRWIVLAKGCLMGGVMGAGGMMGFPHRSPSSRATA